ncbi:MAG: DNA-3-methyladenine glycosylase I [Acidimicrobiia bacterium]|nr:DNA-3-methyladenine glycosylase I [Acidimicrobiia bacterium]
MADADRCDWAGSDPLYVTYHDVEWGVPVHDDRVLFEFITLEGAQAGLSWITILRKRQRYREVFAEFDLEAVAAMSPERVDEALLDTGIVRNRAKVESTISNAGATLAIASEHGSFADYLWSWVNGAAIQNAWRSLNEVPAQTELSTELSKDLKRRGLRFVGPTIMYAFMQAVGMVNDHVVGCPRWRELGGDA